MWVPSPVKRSSGIRPNFLCDTSSYLLGVDGKGKADRSIDCFAASKALHLQLLKEVDSPVAAPSSAFLSTGTRRRRPSHPALQEDWEELLKGGNLTFSLDKLFAALDPAIADAWTRHYEDSSADAEPIRCLVTGQTGTLARLHPSIKGVAAHNPPAPRWFPSTLLPSAPSSTSRAPTPRSATTQLSPTPPRSTRCWPTATVSAGWATPPFSAGQPGGESAYQDCFLMSIFNDSYTENDILNTLHHPVQRRIDPVGRHQAEPRHPLLCAGACAQRRAAVGALFLAKQLRCAGTQSGAALPAAGNHPAELRQIPTLPIWRLVLETVRKVPGRAPGTAPAPCRQTCCWPS